MKKIIRIALFLAITTLVSAPIYVSAQGPGFSGDVEDGGAPCTPLDGGLGLLLVAGVGYGAKLLIDKRKQKN